MNIGWGEGGPTDRLNRRVAAEVRRQLARNAVARRARYPLGHRILHKLMAPATFGLFLRRYLILALALLALEALLPARFVPALATGGPADEIMKSVPSYLLGAQIGLLGVISLALALVTMIAQRDDATTDVKLYYHESLFFGITASSLALAAVLCVQFFWPLQALLGWLAATPPLPVYKLALVALHMLWFVTNLWAAAHFIAVTFRFVQRRARERLRERYTANVVLPRDITRRLRQQNYATVDGAADRRGPHAWFGHGFSNNGQIELEATFAPNSALVDVRLAIVRWVVGRWRRRCLAGSSIPSRGRGPMLYFAPSLDQPMAGRVAWCRRNGGVPLTRFERWALRRAFRFTELGDAD